MRPVHGGVTMNPEEAAHADWEDEGGAGPWGPPPVPPRRRRAAVVLGLLFGSALAIAILLLLR
jgi:hypothetical protein